jgi:predicted DNA-binding ribbon-helix-helix protein
MNNNKGSKENDIQRLMEQYKETMRSLVKQGKLTHRELEKNLTDVIEQMSLEAKKVTAEIIEEEVTDARKKNTKNLPVRVVEEKPESMPKTKK